MNTSKLMGQRVVRSLSRQRGASLLEGIAYLGIAAIVVLGAVSLLTGAFSSAQSNRVAEEVVSIRTAVKKMYMGQNAGYGTSANDHTATLIAANVLPSTINIAAGVASNTWGGTVTVVGNGNINFDIVYTAVPQDACINILSGASGWTNIAGSGGTPITTFPATPAAAQLACGPTNTITWTSL